MHQSLPSAIVSRTPLAIDEALKAGMAAAACSMLLLTAIFVAMVLLPVGIG